MTDDIIEVGPEPEHSYEPDVPSYWYKLGKQHAIEGEAAQSVDPMYSQFQSDYDDGYRTGEYLEPVLDRETI